MSDENAVRNFSPPGLPPTMGFSHISAVGALVFTSGQLAVDESGALVGKGDFAAQLEQAFANLDTALRGAGSSLKNAVRLTYFVAASVTLPELANLGIVRDKYVDTAAPPASSLIFVPRFITPDYLFEIEAIAVAA